jgi:2-hydroxy-6-oxonona-2,4-dienedioate hydrolase
MLNYRRYGSGKTVVLQHGFVGGGEYFAPLSAYLAPGMDVIATDLPGFAGSAREPVPDSIAGLAASLVDTVTALGVERFSLLGHSMGSMTALQAALDYPDRIEKLVLYGGSATGDLPQRFEPFEKSIARIEAEGIDDSAARIAATWFMDGENHPLYEFTRTAGAGADLAGAVACLRAIGRWDVADRLGEISMPTLVICGDHDRSTHPDQSIELWQGIPGAQLCVLPGCAHNAHLELSDVFNRIVHRFLTSDS